MADKMRLTRRKVLGALGAAGAGAALGGAGTMAFFSDEETFEENRLVAGSLDLRVDWEEHYSDWLGEEAQIESARMVRSADEVGDDEIGLPDPENPLIAVAGEDLDAFMDATSIEAFPDADNDGIQDNFEEDGEFAECEDLAQLDEDLDPREDGLRTNNDDTLPPNSDSFAPLVNLTDVKPGDFGELTLSFHLCDNPGYLWLTGGLVEAAENGVTEPEGQDSDESGPEDEVTDDVDEAEVELLDEIQTLLWYDENGNNVFESGAAADPVCVQIVLDASGSMSGERNTQAINAAQNLAESIINASGDNQVGVTFFSADGYDSGAQVQQSVSDAGATDVTTTQNVIGTLPADGGSTAIGEGIETADGDLGNCPDDHRAIQIVVTDGSNNAGIAPATAADNAIGNNTDEIFAVGTGGATESSLMAFARPSDDAHTAFADQPAELNNILGQISQILIGEEAFFRGSLRELLQVLESSGPNNVAGIPLDGNRSTPYDEVVGDDPGEPNDGSDSNRDCYVASTTNNIGFAWWLPADHGNEIQSDSVTFDLGFYTEQCRHNDGLGIPTGNNST